MHFDDLDTIMRSYETAHDFCIPQDFRVICRIDGRSFTKMTREIGFEKPFDLDFVGLMRDTLKYLMQDCGFGVLYGHTHSDEISLLMAREEASFDRKTRKWDSVLASEAGAKFSLLLHNAYPNVLYSPVCAFDCRTIPLPSNERIVDYFRWRQEDAFRNARNAYCYTALRDDGLSGTRAASTLDRMPTRDREELLYQHGIDFNATPVWQRRGVGAMRETYTKDGFNPLKQETVHVERKRIVELWDLPHGDEYGAMIAALAIE